MDNQHLKKYPILIVDDEVYIRDDLSLVLERAGFSSVITAESGEAGLSVLEKEAVALIISDQSMPNMSGTDFLAFAKSNHPETVSIMLSALSEKEDLLAAINQAGAFHYLVKPWNKNELLHHVVSALEFYHTRQEQNRLARANQHLLDKMVQMESVSIMGEFSKELYHYSFPIIEKKMQIKIENDRREDAGDWLHLARIFSRLGQLSIFHMRKQQFVEKSIISEMQACLNTIKSEARKRNIKVNWHEDYSDDTPVIYVQKDIFYCAIKELVENAIIFSQKGQEISEITIKVYIENTDVSYLIIDIQDNGTSTLNPRRIFSPLFTTCKTSDNLIYHDLSTRLEAVNLSKEGHIGLGLSVARYCLALHDGLLTLENPGEEGALFRIRIPALQDGLIPYLDDKNYLIPYANLN